MAWKDCPFGAPGLAYWCPPTATVTITGVDVLQPTLAVNACTGHVILGYRQTNDDVKLRFYNRDLVLQKEYLVAANQRWGSSYLNPGCQSPVNGVIRKCGSCGGTPCLPDDANVVVATSIETVVVWGVEIDTCYAAVAYDTMIDSGGSNWYAKSKLKVYDVTDENSIAQLRAYQSTSSSFQWNQYLSYVVFNDFVPGNLGWFWTSDNQGPCSVGVEGYVSSNFGGNLSATGKFAGTWPAILHGSYGMNDYNFGVTGGVPGGWLMPVWGQSVVTSSSCQSCQSQNWSLAAKMTRILP